MTLDKESTNSPIPIAPCLWFDDNAEEAVNFYLSVFDDAEIKSIARYGQAGYDIHGREAGSIMTIDFEIEGHPFTALNGGPHFTFTPAISFFVNCKSPKEVDALWEKLSESGTPLMPLDSYPFSDRYGWIQDRYGLSWQIMLTSEEPTQKIVSSLLFVGDQAGRAEEAIRYYADIFDHSAIGDIQHYGENQAPNAEGTVMYADFRLLEQKFAAMDSAADHDFSFNEAISLVVSCDTQEEIDYYWEKLSAHSEAEQCGWLKDQFGISWQITPKKLGGLFRGEATKESEQAMEAMLQMKKLDIGKLQEAMERSPKN